MEATSFSETSIVFQRYIPEDRNLRRSQDYLKSSSRTINERWNKIDAEENSRVLFEVLSRVNSGESEERDENPVRTHGDSGEIRACRLTIMSLRHYRYTSSLN
jgi:hypothetical protein